MRRLVGAVLAAALVVAAVVLQLSVLSRLDLPAATPDLVLVTTAALGAARGSSVGALAGFGGGLLLDLAPPSDHPAGQWALVLTLVGYGAGRLCADTAVAPAVRCIAVGWLAAVATFGYVAMSAALGAGWPGVGGLGAVALAAGAYACLLAVPVLPTIGWAAERLATRGPGW